MNKIKIFKSDKEIDLSTFIDSRALICANSGGGKSYAIRKILEETQDKVLSIILDVEGEFKTLREQYDFLLIGNNADVSLNMKSASLLPRKILELEVSTIIDISDLKMHERIMYVKSFLESLMELPRELWKPCIVVVDEAHLYCGQQEKQESTHAVIDLMTRGRKRGFCGILATQRIAKLHKDSVAETNNYMVGRIGLDIDMKRASEILGFTSKEQMLSLRDLEPGEFYVFGTAISKHVEKEKIGEVKTTHPKVGIDVRKNIVTPTEKIKSILQKISDLPKEQEIKLKEKSDYEKKIKELERENREIKLSKPRLAIDENLLKKEYSRGYKDAENILIPKQKEIENIYKRSFSELEKEYKVLEKRFQDIGKIIGAFVPKTKFEIPKIDLPEINSKHVSAFRTILEVKPVIKKLHNVSDINDTKQLRAGAMKMLNWLAGSYPEELSKQRLATLSGFSVKGGTFNTYISELKRNGWIVGNNELKITEEGLDHASPEEIPSGDELLNLWKGKFREGAGKILQFVYDNKFVTKEEIGNATSFEISGGTFNTYLSELRRNGLIEVEGQEVKISEEF